MITNSLPVIGCEPDCCPVGRVILNVMLEAAALAERAKLSKRQAMGSLVQRRTRFMVSPGELKEVYGGKELFHPFAG
jgi:hypothetical protein